MLAWRHKVTLIDEAFREQRFYFQDVLHAQETCMKRPKNEQVSFNVIPHTGCLI